MKNIWLIILGVLLALCGFLIMQSGLVFSFLGGAVGGAGIGLVVYGIRSRRSDSEK